ncbi:MAG: hypothetical protein JWO03_2285 [Bacteroidetes bacterium]|nr:hypothetical protein [Bacteroidota bacterium]
MKPLLLIAVFITGALHAQTWTHVDIPNDFCDQATIVFDLVSDDSVTLDVHNRGGDIVQVFCANKPLAAGHYEVTLEGESLAPEIYTIRYSDTHTQIAKQVTKACATGISDPKPLKSIGVYPNPGYDIVTVPIEGIKQIVLTDLGGRICKSINTTEKMISISELAAGDYVLSVFDHSGVLMGSAKITKDK